LISVESMEGRVASIEDLIVLKRLAGRDFDRLDIVWGAWPRPRDENGQP